MNNQENKKPIKLRCSFCDCKKKISLLNQFKCRCGLIFCSKHKLPENHNCTFDYKNLKLKMEKVVAPKLNKI